MDPWVRRITINPITRLEGHGKIEIFLDDQGDVADAYMQVTELAWIRAVLSGKAGRRDAPDRSQHLRCLPDSSQHGVHQGPRPDIWRGAHTDGKTGQKTPIQRQLYRGSLHPLLFSRADRTSSWGRHANPAERNILGVIGKVGLDIGKQVIDVTAAGTRDIIKLIASKPAHPEGGLPGGVPRGITEEERQTIIETANLSVEFAQFALQLFKDVVLGNKAYLDLILSDAYNLKTYYMALVDENNKQN